MAEKTYPIPENPVFNMEIRALQDSDPASASTIFNPLIERLIENLCALKLLLDGKVGADGMQEALTGINNSLSEINTALAGKAAANHSHSGYAGASHNHDAGNITSGILPIARGGLGNDSGYVRAGQKAGTTIGNNATAEGAITTASGKSSHAEGENSYATAFCTHAEGHGSRATGISAHSEGTSAFATGDSSHAEGHSTIASNYASHSSGKYSKDMTTGGEFDNKVGDVFVIGNGSSINSRSNAFRITYAGETYGLSYFNSSGADYAEYFEWQDANPEAEDRVGYFVTLQGDKICLAQAGDYLLGIVSANPCIIGNADEDWLGRWEHDDFGRFIQIDVETPVTEFKHKEVPVLDENGELTGEVRFETEKVPTGEVIHGWDYKQNPAYDNTQQYIERKDRPEWAAIGMVGVLAVRDDGSCQVNGFCQCSDGGIATAAEKYIPGNTYRVIARVTENIVKVVFR